MYRHIRWWLQKNKSTIAQVTILYPHFRVLCGGKHAEQFSDFSDMFTAEQIEMLRSVYSHVDDVDLYLGGLLEKPMAGSLLGQTFSCIIADQVKKTKKNENSYFSI